MNQYEFSLIAMKRLLDAVGESHWAKWIDTDITEWRSNRDATHHLAAYGGMGSFNDIWIRQTMFHRHAPRAAVQPMHSLFELAVRVSIMKRTVCFISASRSSTFRKS